MSSLFILIGFAAVMITVSWASRRQRLESNVSEFLLSSRDVGVVRGAFSIAISWVWAPAIFIAGLQAYTLGLAGAFWFIIPNILCFFLFAQVAKRLRKDFPEGFTLPEFIKHRFKSTRLHRAFLVIFFGYQLSAITINSVAGGTLIHLLTGMNFSLAVLAISGTALLYSIVGGFRASLLTDVIQMVIVLGLAGFMVPWVISEAGGLSSISGGLAGIDGVGRSILNPHLAWTFGIPMTLGLLAGPLGDQQFFQRAFAVKQDAVSATFNLGGMLFGLIPILLCLFGFIAANPNLSIEVIDPQMVAPAVITHFLPAWALGLFTLMAFAGLCSTIDSAYCALSSFAIADISHDSSPRKQIAQARWMMLFMGILGTGIALLQPQLLWIFLIYGALVSAGFFPTLFSVFSRNYSEKAAFWSVVLGLVIGLPLSVYSNVSGHENLVVWAAILSVAIGLVISLLSLTSRSAPSRI